MINKLSQVNLNLLNVLDLLLGEKNTTSAAKKLNISQPAISYDLKILREIFEDELLIKNPFSKTMTLTPFARTLIKPLKDLVDKAELVFNTRKFDPATSRRQIKIATTDYALGLIIPELIKEVKKSCPFLSFHISDLLKANTREQLLNEDIDFALGTFKTDSNDSTFVYEHILKEEILCWADCRHPAFQGNVLTMEDYMKYPHIEVRIHFDGWVLGSGNFHSPENISSENINNISVHITTELISLLPGSEYICLGSRRVGQKYAPFYRLKSLPPPFKIPILPITLCRKAENKTDHAISYIYSQIKIIADKIDQT